MGGNDGHEGLWDRVWGHQLTGYSLLLILCVVCVYWNLWIPAPGKAVTILGISAAVMTLRTQISGREKTFWLILLFVLVFTELRAINSDRREYAEEQRAARSQDQQKFDAILQQNQRDFDAAVSTLKSLISSGQQVDALTQQTLKNVTGGESFCYFDLGFPQPRTGQLLGMIFVKGKYPLHDAWLSFVDVTKFRELASKPRPTTIEGLINLGRQVVQLNDLPGDSQRPLLELHIRDDGTDKIFNIQFGALNGNWNEKFRLKRVNGEWRRAIEVNEARHGQSGKLIYEQVDPLYPKVNGQVDWGP